MFTAIFITNLFLIQLITLKTKWRFLMIFWFMTNIICWNSNYEISIGQVVLEAVYLSCSLSLFNNEHTMFLWKTSANLIFAVRRIRDINSFFNISLLYHGHKTIMRLTCTRTASWPSLLRSFLLAFDLMHENIIYKQRRYTYFF